jgi:hypothetical protein
MSDDVLGRPERDGMSETDEPMVAQHRRNRRGAHVAQPTALPGDRSTHMRPRLVAPRRAALGLAACAVLSGCASPVTSGGVHPDGGGVDSAAIACMQACASAGLTCSQGRCTSMACGEAEKVTNSSVGCLFYTLQPDNVTADEAAVTSFLVTTQGPDPANVELQQLLPGDGGVAWTAIAGGQVAAGGASLRLPISALQVTAAGVTTAGALRLSSDRPVTVAEIESDDVALPASSSGGSMILPVQALNADYRVVTYAQQTSPDIEQTVGSRGGAARVIVIGTQPQTVVTFTPVSPVTADPNGYTPGLDAGTPYQVVLGDGDVFQIYSGAEGEDLTGAQVSSTAPVAVFSGNITTSYGSQVTGINSADMAHEQMPPVAAWSDGYVAAALTPQASIGCTSLFGVDGASIWRVLAGHAGTLVTLSGPAAGLPAPFTLDAGQSRSIVVAGSFAVEASYPVLVTQGIDCEPSLSIAIAVDSTPLYTDLPFAVPPGFDVLLGIVRTAGSEVDLDGPSGAIADALFTRVSPLYEVAAVPLPPCAPTDGSGVCTHRLTSTGGFGMSLRGMDVRSSYALSAPLLVRCTTSTEFCLN